MKRGSWVLLILVGLFIAVNSNQTASAYINPGTGAAVIGSIWPVIAAFFSAMLAFLIKHFWSPIKRFFKKFL